MTADCELWRLGAVELTTLYRSHAVSPVEVLESVLARIAEVNPVINAIISLDGDGAKKSALESEARWLKREPLGLLDGVPITIKDAINVEGLPTHWGSRLFSDYIPSQDELSVARVRAAGGIILGKTNVPEFTLRGYTDNAIFGATRNPWNPTLTPGGSSGGSVAAVAAGFGPLSMGVDAGGSIRRPAGFTNLIGHKPSQGRVPRLWGLPMIVGDYETVGPIAHTPADAAALLAVITKPDLRDRDSWAFRGWPFKPDLTRDPLPQRILLIEQFRGSPVDNETAASVGAAARLLQELGHHVEIGEAPFDTRAFGKSFGVISRTGMAWAFKDMPWRERAGTEYHAGIEEGLAKLAIDYVEAIDVARRLRMEMATVYERCDVIMTPSSAAQPWPVEEKFPSRINGQEVDGGAHNIFTGFANISGYPAMSIPCAPSRAGLPIGFQLVGRFGEDALLFEIASQFERAQAWAGRRPTL